MRLHVLVASYDHAKDLELDRLSYRIRLAHKYDMKDLLQISVYQSKVLYPSVVFRWTDIENAHPYSTRAIAAVNLARLTETPFLLPSALYVC